MLSVTSISLDEIKFKNGVVTLKDEKQPKNVEVLIKFMRIGEIDTINEKYHAEIRIESKWIENEDIVEYDRTRHWNPELFIENSFNELKEEINYELIKQNGKTYVTEIRIAKGELWEKLELYNFPFDIQELSVSVSTKKYFDELRIFSDPMELNYINSAVQNTFIDQQKWKLFKLVVISKHASYDQNIDRKSDKIVATCYCARKAGYYLFNAYFLIFVITSSALTIFSVDCKLPQNRLQITFIILLTSVSFKWVINRYLPTVSYLTSLDTYAIVSILYICLLCVWHSLIGRFWDKPLGNDIDNWALIVFAILLVFIHICFLFWVLLAFKNIWKLKEKEKQFIAKLKNIAADNQESRLTKRRFTVFQT